MRDTSSRVTEKYLARYAEPGTQAYAASLQLQNDQPYAYALIVPAYDEDPGGIQAIAERCRQHHALLILVVNTPANAPADCIARTTKLLQTCRAPNTLIIDRVTTPLNSRHGVGLARKIGSDITLALIDQGKVLEPWLFQTDADVVLPTNYFSASPSAEGTVTFAHRHYTDDVELARAVDLYDRHMAYYVAGLQYAGSDYAYYSLGSCMAIHAQSYAAVRGFPKRNAGEDFHILNKLAKVGSITHCTAIRVAVAARHSQRVPYGTGPALKKIATVLDNGSPADFLSYHPGVFEALRELLAQLRAFAHAPSKSTFSQPVRSALDSLGWAKFAPSLQKSAAAAQRLHLANEWFDALRTLRFIHHMQKSLPDQPLLATLSSIDWENRSLPE